MKTLAIAVALSAAFVLPAHSQAFTFDLGNGQAWASERQAAGAKKRQKGAKQRVAKQPRQAAKPCAARYWGGCLGWDPDPFIRGMIQHDTNIFDD
jgi:hypothetical protein